MFSPECAATPRESKRGRSWAYWLSRSGQSQWNQQHMIFLPLPFKSCCYNCACGTFVSVELLHDLGVLRFGFMVSSWTDMIIQSLYINPSGSHLAIIYECVFVGIQWSLISLCKNLFRVASKAVACLQRFRKTLKLRTEELWGLTFESDLLCTYWYSLSSTYS